jgi:hypothetical protein
MKDIDLIIQSIVTHQRDVLGPLAIEQANTVAGIDVDSDGKVKISLNSPKDSVHLLQSLVKKYEQLFGQASVEVCKDAVKESGVAIDQSELPEILK